MLIIYLLCSTQEISEFNKFLEETGGHCGGWKQGDHLLYQKIIAKHKLEEAADIINDHLPGNFIICLLYTSRCV